MTKHTMKCCFGCGKDLAIAKYYDGDSDTPWCVECFVTEEQLEALRQTMPCWVDFQKASAGPKKMKIRLVSKPTPEQKHIEAAVVVAPATDSAVPKKAQKVVKKVTLPSTASAAASSAPVPPVAPVEKKKPVLLKKAAVEEPTPQKKKPVLLKKVPTAEVAVGPTAPSESSQAASTPPPAEKKKPRLVKKHTQAAPPESAQASA